MKTIRWKTPEQQQDQTQMGHQIEEESNCERNLDENALT